MKHRVIVRDEALRERAQLVVSQLPLDVVHEVVVKPHKTSRTSQQHALYWLWNTYVSAETGETKEEVHFRHKKKFALPIYIRDDPDGFGEMMKAVYQVRDPERTIMLDKIVELTSTTTFSIAQMTEYLNDIDEYCHKVGVHLPVPQYLHLMVKDHRRGSYAPTRN